MSEWIGCDFDGTLAEYNGWIGPTYFGKPITGMVNIIRQHLADGHEVRILTARGNEADPQYADVVTAIQDWCEKYVKEGWRPEVTDRKDYGMSILYDDRAVQVVRNEGVLVQDLINPSVRLRWKF